MRILQITAGAAGMYCGSCMRDNTLAKSLRARGHDVVLQPLYTPTRPDDENASERRVLFGGVSVYLEQHVPLFRHTPAFLDWFWDSVPVLRLASQRQIKVAPAELGDMTVSMLKGNDGHQKKEIRKMLDWLRHEPRFDLVDLPNALLISLAQPLREALGLPIVCTMQGEDLFLDGLIEPWRTEAMRLIRAATPHVDRFVATSDFYAEYMAGYLGIPRAKIATVPIGVRADGYAPPVTRTEPPLVVGYFARVAPEKGLQVLLQAYRRVRALPSVPATRLVAGGFLLDEHKPYLAAIEREVAEAGLSSEFSYVGSPDREEKMRLLSSMDVFSVPAPYAEPKGLSVLEAMAAGVPVVQPRHGAFTEMIERTGGGLLVPPGDPDALAAALFALLTDRSRAATVGRAGAEGVRRLYSPDVMAQAAESVYADVVSVRTSRAATAAG